jgi:hypothetical protein
MIDQLSNRLKHGVCKSTASGYEYSEEVNAEAIAQIPHLRLVK